MVDMAAVDAHTGFQPYESVIQAHLYSVITANATAFFIGDLVKHSGIALATPHKGTLLQVVQHAAGADGVGLGAVIGCFDHTMKPLLYIPTSTTGNGTIAGYVMVADHPDQIYIAHENGGTGSLVAGDIGLNADAIATHAGSSNTGLSGMEIDSNSSASTATLALKILNVHEEDTLASASTTTGTHCRFIVKINTSSLGDNVKGQS